MKNQQGAVRGTRFPGAGSLTPASDCDVMKAVTEEGQAVGAPPQLRIRQPGERGAEQVSFGNPTPLPRPLPSWETGAQRFRKMLA